MEEWREIPGWEGLYEASSEGRVRSLDRMVHCRAGALRPIKGKVLAAARNRFTGYMMLMLTDGPTRKCRAVHRLVCHAFHGEPPTPDHHAAHNDGDRGNNRATNLRWATPKENTADRYIHGTILLGDYHPSRRKLLALA